MRQPPPFVAAPLAASAVTDSAYENHGGRAALKLRQSASEMPSGSERLVAQSARGAEGTTPFKLGVSDLGCGRGHDRRRGQISWSLTPRSYSLALSLPWRRLAVGGKRRPCSPSRKSPTLIHLSGVTEALVARRQSIRPGRNTSSKGGTPRAGPCSRRRSPSVVKWLRPKI